MVVIDLNRHPLARKRLAERIRRDAAQRHHDRVPNARLFPLIRTRRAKSRVSS